MRASGSPATSTHTRRWGFVAFGVAALLALNYTLNHFYVRGAYMMDSGWLADLSTQTAWPPPNPPAITDGTYFRYHFSPFFWLYAQPWGALDHLGLAPPPAVWFALSQAAWFGALALGVYLLAARRSSEDPGLPPPWAAALGVLTAFCGASLAVLGFAHFEIGIPALAICALALQARGRFVAAIPLLVVGLLLREDAGLHYLGLFGLLAVVAWRRRGDAEWRRRAHRFTAIAASCGVYAAASMVAQARFFPTTESSFARIYSGTPAWGHVTWDFVAERLGYFATERAALWIPIVAVGALSVVGRSALLAVGAVVVVPWLAVSLLAVTPEAGHLTSHYAFPLVVTTAWPVVAWGLDRSCLPTMRSRPWASVAAVAAVIAATVLIYPTGEDNHDRDPFRSFGPTWTLHVAQRQAEAERLVRGPEAVDVVDDAIASLVPREVRPGQWRYLMAFSPQELARVRTIGFQPTRSWVGVYAQRASRAAHLVVQCPAGDSGFQVARRAPLGPGCVALRP